MENLAISEPQQGGMHPPPPPDARGPPQLPPQMFTTAAQLLDLTDKKLMVVLRDGRKLVGVLRSWDQFANIVLQSTTERIFAQQPSSSATTTTSSSSSPDTPQPQGIYADIHHGIFLVRGENVLLLGEIDLDKDDVPPPGYALAELEVVKKLADEKKATEKRKDRARVKKLAGLGFEGDNVGEVVLL